MTFFNMMRNFFHKMTFQMNDLSTFYTLQVQMLFTSPSRFYILISSLATFLCNIFDHSSILCKLVQIAVNGCDIYLTVMFLQILIHISSCNRMVITVFQIFKYFSAACCRITASCHNFIIPPKISITVHSVHSNLAKIHSRLPAAMEFWLVCLGILAYSCQNTSRDSDV